jgi:hypothetical protein
MLKINIEEFTENEFFFQLIFFDTQESKIESMITYLMGSNLLSLESIIYFICFLTKKLDIFLSSSCSIIR